MTWNTGYFIEMTLYLHKLLGGDNDGLGRRAFGSEGAPVDSGAGGQRGGRLAPLRAVVHQIRHLQNYRHLALHLYRASKHYQ